MAKEIIMPALGMAQETGKVLKWFKAEGETVRAGEPLLEIETDKTTFELEAPTGGVLANVTASEGDEVPVGTVIAAIRAPDELAAPSPADLTGSIESAPKPKPERPAIAVTKQAGGSASATAGSAAMPSQESFRRPLASPKARRMAVERGLNLDTIHGTGPVGAVLAADLLSAEKHSAAAVETPGLALSTTWRIMAQRTTQSWTTVPHFYLLRDVNAGQLVAWRETFRKRSQKEISYTDMLTKLVAATLRRYPRLNAEWKDGTIILKDEINLGLAVAIDDGVVVPVIHKADQLSLDEIATRRKDLVARARARKLRLEDIQGGTFTISNLGMYAVDAFNAIVNHPQAAILAVGRIAQRVVAVDNQPVVQPMVMVTLSCDHRVVDGARAAEFLESLADLLEEPLGVIG